MEDRHFDPSKPIILPYPGCKPLLGINETVITREDMTSFYSWYRLACLKETYLEETDFKDRDLYYKYWMLSSGLMEFPVVLVGGQRGGGKSLCMNWLGYQNYRLFGKRVTMEKPPPEPEYFGNIHYLHDQDYIDRIILDMARLDQIERETGKRPPPEELEKCILYNAVLILDECHMWGEKSHRTNLTRLINRIMMIARHLYCCMYFAFVDIERADQLIYNPKTHIINCGKDWFPYRYPSGTCSYQVMDIRPGGTGTAKFLHLYPQDWLHIWDSYNIPTLVHDVEIYLGGNKKPKRESNIDLQAAAAAIKNKE